MKVILIGPAFPLRGGIADFNEALAISLQDAGHQVIIYSFNYQYPTLLFPGTSQVAAGEAPKNLIIRPTLNSVNPLSWYRTASEIISEKPDLVLIRYWIPFMGPALGTVAKKIRQKKIKVIAITDNVIPHEKRPGDKMLTKYFINQCDGFITMSQSVYDELNQFTDTNDKILLPHPIYNIFGDRVVKSVARKNIGMNDNDKVILFFGFIRAYKGLNLLLDAMSDKRIRNGGIKLVIAGEFYEDKAVYLEKIKTNELSQSVILHTEFIDKGKVKDYFCAADMVVQPYLNATQSGITQIAYYFGRPMLVTNVGGLAEIVPDKRVGYVTEKKASAIADAICDFYDNNREKEFSINVDLDKEKFSWENFIEGVFRLYDKIK